MDMKVIPAANSSHRVKLDAKDRRLIAAIQGGLPLCPRPYKEVAEQLGMSETEVIERIQHFNHNGYIKRFGVVVRHRELGYRANGMVVWDIADDQVDQVGQCLGQFDFVTLCYRRPRHLPAWPYNLFCMIHGVDRHEVQANVELIIRNCNMQAVPHAVLFSKQRFKQRGAYYTSNKRARGSR